MGRPAAQRHTIDFKLPEGLLGSLGKETLTEGIPKMRLAGAVAAGVGTFLMVRVMQKTVGDVLRTGTDLFGQLFQASTFFTSFFVPEVTEAAGEVFPSGEDIFGKESLLALDPFAISIGLITGGMILAGQNPGELLKGIGEIIPG